MDTPIINDNSHCIEICNVQIHLTYNILLYFIFVALFETKANILIDNRDDLQFCSSHVYIEQSFCPDNIHTYTVTAIMTL